MGSPSQETSTGNWVIFMWAAKVTGLLVTLVLMWAMALNAIADLFSSTIKVLWSRSTASSLEDIPLVQAILSSLGITEELGVKVPSHRQEGQRQTPLAACFHSPLQAGGRDCLCFISSGSLHGDAWLFIHSALWFLSFTLPNEGAREKHRCSDNCLGLRRLDHRQQLNPCTVASSLPSPPAQRDSRENRKGWKINGSPYRQFNR